MFIRKALLSQPMRLFSTNSKEHKNKLYNPGRILNFKNDKYLIYNCPLHNSFTGSCKKLQYLLVAVASICSISAYIHIKKGMKNYALFEVMATLFFLSACKGCIFRYSNARKIWIMKDGTV